MKLILFVLLIVFLSISNVSAACTTLCYVDNDGTGDYTTDGTNDEVEINAAIANVESYSTPSNRGTVVLNNTSTPYMIYGSIAINSGNIILRGESRNVPANLLNQPTGGAPATNAAIAINANNVDLKNIYINGGGGWTVDNPLSPDYNWCCGIPAISDRREIRLNVKTPYINNIVLENLTGYNTGSDFIWGYGTNVTVNNIDCDYIGHSCVSAYGNKNVVSNWHITNVSSTNDMNAAFRSNSITGLYLNGLESIDAGNFCIEIEPYQDTNPRDRDQYYENVTCISPVIAGVSILTSSVYQYYEGEEWHSYNITLKNILIDCQNDCARWAGSEDDYGAGIAIGSSNDITIDGATILNVGAVGDTHEHSGIMVVNYRDIPSTITIKNSIIANNKKYGISTRSGSNSNFNWNITYNDIWGNSVAATSGYVTLGTGNFYVNPQFASDYRLKSQYGRWTGSAWVNDAVTSPAIDAGDPASDSSNEPDGSRINMGFDGNTIYASKSATGNYSISGYVLDNNDDLLYGAFVSTSSTDSQYVISSTTNSGGWFNITGIYNGTYNISYSKASGGFTEEFLNVTIDGVSNTTANKTIYDTTAPEIIGLTATKINISAVRLDYNVDSSASWYKIYRGGVLKATTQNITWMDTDILPDNTYYYLVSANDTYGNQGSNSSVDITVSSWTLLELLISSDTSIKNGSGANTSRGELTYTEIGYLSDVGSIYRTLQKFDISSIPANATIAYALLNLTNDATTRTVQTDMSLYRANMTWVSSSTWNDVSGGSWVDAAGTNNGSVGFATRSYSTDDTTNTSLNITNLINGMVNGTWTNNGWILKTAEPASTDYYSYNSAEASASLGKPILTIYYTEYSESESVSSTVTDDYNIWIDGSDMGDVTDLFYNLSSLSPDSEHTISIRAHNHTYNSYSEWSNSTVTTLPGTPIINSNLNNITSNSDLAFDINVNNAVLFSVGSNQTITTWTWGTATKIGGDGTTNSTASKFFNTVGAGQTVTVYGTNTNGTTSTLTWTVNVLSGGGGGTDYDYLTGTVNVAGATISTSPNVGSTTGGAYTFGYVFEDGETYWINVSKTGYNSNNTQITFNEDHEVWNPILTEMNTTTWWNSKTNDNSLVVHLVGSESALFSINNSDITTAEWTLDGTVQSETTTLITISLNTLGVHTLTVYGNTLTGVTETISWKLLSVREKSGAGDVTALLNDTWFDSLRDSMNGSSPDFTQFVSAMVLPYTTQMGSLFYVFIYLLPLATIWLRQEKVLIPAGLLGILGLLLIPMLPAEWRLLAGLCVILTSFGVVYSLFKERG